MKNLDSTGLKRLHRQWRRSTTDSVALLLDSVQTPFNVGSILRSAAAYRVEEIWAAGRTESARHPKVQKTAMGSDRFVTIHEPIETIDAIGEITAAGYRLVGVELATDARPLHELDLRGRVCLAVGHEDRGLSQAVLDASDAVGFLPLLGKIGSLNVATATAMALYELRRQEWTAD